MFFMLANRSVRIVAGLTAAGTLLVCLPNLLGEEKLADPILRVANDAPAAQAPATSQTTATAAPTAAAAVATPTAPAAPAAGGAPFDLTAKPGEHPLAPVLRAVKATQDEIDKNVRDYSCTFVKQERIDGDLAEKQFILLKVMQKPFSVYMSFVQPYNKREIVYVEGQNDGKMIVLEAGFKRMLGKMNLEPTGTLAMKGQKRPITDVGIRNLNAKLAKMWEAETKYLECNVTTKPNEKINDRATTMIQVVHPVQRDEFKFHIARLFIDNQLKVPIHFDAYLWEDGGGNNPPLEESYTYTNLKLNNGFTAREFDTKNNPEIFKQ